MDDDTKELILTVVKIIAVTLIVLAVIGVVGIVLKGISIIVGVLLLLWYLNFLENS